MSFKEATKTTGPCPLRIAARPPGGEREVIALVVMLATVSDAAHKARIRMATSTEALRTNCPADWPCVVVDATMTPEALASVRSLAASFEAGIAFARRTSAEGERCLDDLLRRLGPSTLSGELDPETMATLFPADEDEGEGS